MISYVYLILYFILKIFSDGKFIVPIAAWVTPFLIIRFLRYQKFYIGIPIGLLASFISFCISWYKMIPLDTGYFLLMSFGINVVFFIPYIIDKLTYKKINGFLSTLILPLLFVILEYINVIFNPYGTWGAVANTQFESKYILQIVSITGIWGITFMIYWFASTLNWIIENKFQLKIIKPAIIYLIIFLSIIFYGSFRIHIFYPKSETIKIVTMNNSKIEDFINSDLYKNVYKKMMRDLLKGIPVKQEDIDLIQKEWTDFSYSIIHDTEVQAKSGAKIISWAEVNAYLLKNDDKVFLEECSKLAKKYRIYFQVGLWTVDFNKNKKPAENRIITIDPDGELIEDYHKFINLPGYDAIVTNKGTKIPLCFKTEFGIISTLNCFENAFPYYARKIGNADIVFNPSKDWEAIDPYITHQAGIRAVENGYSIVRHTAFGLSASYDYLGNTISKLDYFKSNKQDNVMVSYVPKKGVITLYSLIGDLFAWLSFVGLIIIIFWYLIFQMNKKK